MDYSKFIVQEVWYLGPTPRSNTFLLSFLSCLSNQVLFIKDYLGSLKKGKKEERIDILVSQYDVTMTRMRLLLVE